MRRILIFIVFLVSVVSLISCSSGSSSSSAPGGVNPGFPSDIQLLPIQYIVQTNSDAFFKARVLDGNGTPISGVAVTFTNISPIGSIDTAKAVKKGSIKKSGTTVANTNSLGYATARVWSPTAGFVTVQAEVNAGTGKVRDKKTIYFTTYDFSFPVPPPPTLDLAVDGEDADVIFDETEDFNLFETPDDDEVIVQATVLDGNGVAAAFVNVTFGVDSLEATFPDGSTKMTDSNGKAQVRVKVAPGLKDVATNINITASATVGGKDAFNMVTLFLPPINITIGGINLNATPAQVAPGAKSVIDAYVTISTGGPVPDGTTVNFTTTCGFVVPFGQTTDGKATVDFTAPATFGTCTITGTVGIASDTVDVVVSNALFVTPASQTVAVLPPPAPLPGPVTYNITGGTAPYTAYSNNPLVTVGVSGSTLTATVTGVPTADTTVTITVYDSVNASKTATLILDVPPLIDLTVIPAEQTISNPTLSSSAVYTVMGGTGPYTAFSSNPGLVTVPAGTFAGPTFTANVDGLPTVDTTVTITVYDSVGASATADLILDVPSDSLQVIPTAQTKVPPFTTAAYTVIGGIGPYSAFSGNPGLVTVPATFAGPTLTATIIATPSVDTTVSIAIYDSAGSSVSADLVLDVAGVEPLKVSPTAVTVTGIANPDVDPADDVTFTITGGTGPFSMFSNNNAIIASQGVLVGSTFVVDPDSVAASTPVIITVEDSLGATVTATVTVTPPVSSFSLQPSAISVLEGDAVTVYIMGGTGPYNTYTTDPVPFPNTCVPAPQTVPGPPAPQPRFPDTQTSFVVGPIPSGCAGQTHKITLEDSIGRLATFTITINPDVTAPTVISTSPVNGASGVAVLANVTINWSENVDCATVNTTNVTIAPPPVTAWTLTSCSGSSATFSATKAASTLYTVTVSTAVTDTSGNAMVSPYIFSFTTAP